MQINKQFTFEAAHRLPNVPNGHKCARLHGHSYRITLHVSGPIGEKSGWIMDFSDLKDAWNPLHKVLDHYYLNDVEGLENPTSEILSMWIWQKLKPTLPELCEVQVSETCTSGCSYKGD